LKSAKDLNRNLELELSAKRQTCEKLSKIEAQRLKAAQASQAANLKLEAKCKQL
jgi:hypothetical protein